MDKTEILTEIRLLEARRDMNIRIHCNLVANKCQREIDRLKELLMEHGE